MKSLFSLFAQFVGTVLAADFVAGFIHWMEDAYIREETPLVGKLVARPNIVHHHYPRYMTRHSWLRSSWDLALFAVTLILVAWKFHFLTWHVWLFAALTANANQVHKWSHQTRAENGRLISFLQDIHVLQTAKHHARHHTDPKNSHYCVITNILNPILDGFQFWDGLEWVLAQLYYIYRRPDTSVRGHGPGPKWLAEFQRPAVKAGAV